jgi:SAM-dependent methyltransferase
MSQDAETIRIYNDKAGAYAALADASKPMPMLERFLDSLPAGGHVLDLGCGPGRAAARMAARGFQTTAMDASAEMIARAARHPGVTPWQASFDALQSQAEYDAVWASFSLLHAPRARMPLLLRAIHTALKPAGLFHIALKLGQGEARDSLGRFYSYYQEDELRGLLTTAGFTPGQASTGSDTGLDGSTSDWIALSAVKADSTGFATAGSTAAKNTPGESGADHAADPAVKRATTNTTPRSATPPSTTAEPTAR